MGKISSANLLCAILSALLLINPAHGPAFGQGQGQSQAGAVPILTNEDQYDPTNATNLARQFETGISLQRNSFNSATSGSGSFAQQMLGNEISLEVLQSLFGQNAGPVSWPPPPRIWTDRWRDTNYSASAFVGPQLPVFRSSVAQGIEYRIKTSFLMFGSTRSTRARPDASRASGDLFAFTGEIRNFVYQQEGRAFPNVQPDYPMVGMCAFQLSLKVSVTGSAALSTPAGGLDGAAGYADGVEHNFFSNFFPLSREYSIEWYLENVCGRGFTRYSRRQVEADFRPIAQSMLFEFGSSCRPPMGREIGQPDGDPSCSGWFADNYGEPGLRYLRESTVPRCVQNNRGEHHCQIRAREGKSCTMYYNAWQNRYSEEPQGLYSNVTEPSYRHCDSAQGLQCGFDWAPWFTIPHVSPVGLLTASCKRK